MPGESEYQIEGMQQTASRVDGYAEPLLSKAEVRVMDAARNQGEKKWGTEDLGAPISFGQMYERRLTDLEDQIHRLVQEVGQFSQKVKTAASRANATDDEIAGLFGSQEQSLSDPDRSTAQSSPHTGQLPTTGTWES